LVDRGADATFDASPNLFIFIVIFIFIFIFVVIVAISPFAIAFDPTTALSLVALSQSDAQLV